MIKDVLVNLGVNKPSDRARDYAVLLAESLDAHLTATSFSYTPLVPTVTGFEVIPAEYIDAQQIANENAARLAKSNFERTIGTAGLRADCYMASASGTGAVGLFARMARNFDLTVLPQATDGDSLNDFMIEAALFEGGGPIIVVPYIQDSVPSLKRVLICWDGSKPAARALAAAMPLLRRSAKIEVVTVAEPAKMTEEFPGAEIGKHLARHGLKVEIKRIDIAEIDVANALLSHAADSAADFMVMGAYGHTRLREFVLGGVTREILSSMTVPVLMSH